MKCIREEKERQRLKFGKEMADETNPNRFMIIRKYDMMICYINEILELNENVVEKAGKELTKLTEVKSDVEMSEKKGLNDRGDMSRSDDYLNQPITLRVHCDDRGFFHIIHNMNGQRMTFYFKEPPSKIWFKMEDLKNLWNSVSRIIVVFLSITF